MKTAKLDRWKMVERGPGIIIFTGDVLEDELKRWEDGTPIRTSMAQVISFVEHEPFFVKTLNTHYWLGEPAQGTRALTPNMNSEEKTNPT